MLTSYKTEFKILIRPENFAVMLKDTRKLSEYVNYLIGTTEVIVDTVSKKHVITYANNQEVHQIILEGAVKGSEDRVKLVFVVREEEYSNIFYHSFTTESEGYKQAELEVLTHNLNWYDIALGVSLEITKAADFNYTSKVGENLEWQAVLIESADILETYQIDSWRGSAFETYSVLEGQEDLIDFDEDSAGDLALEYAIKNNIKSVTKPMLVEDLSMSVHSYVKGNALIKARLHLIGDNSTVLDFLVQTRTKQKHVEHTLMGAYQKLTALFENETIITLLDIQRVLNGYGESITVKEITED